MTKKHKSVLLKQEAELLLRSQVIEDHPWLKSFLQANGKVTRAQYNSLPLDKRKILDEMLQPLLTHSIHEWRIVEELYNDLGEDWLTTSESFCVLCNEKLRYEWFIRNVHTRDMILVGSSCVEKFGLETDSGKTASQLRREREQLARREKLARECEGIHQLVSDLYHYPDTMPILIPYDLRNPYLRIGQELEELYHRYLDGKVRKSDEGDSIAKIRLLWTRLRQHREQITQYANKHQNEEFRPRMNLIRFLRSQGTRDAHQAIEWLMDDGIIKERTLFRINEPDFVRSLIPKWNGTLSTVGVSILKVDEPGPRYVFSLRSRNRISLSIQHRDFGLLYGRYLFGDDLASPVDLRELVDRSRIYERDDSINEVVNTLIPPMRALGLRVHDRDRNENVLVLRESSDAFLWLQLSEFAQAMKSAVLGFEDPGEAIIQFTRSVERISAKELQTIKDAMKEFGRAPSTRRRA